MKVYCQKCKKFIMDVEPKEKEVEILCWHCGKKNIVNKNSNSNFILDIFNNDIFNKNK